VQTPEEKALEAQTFMLQEEVRGKPEPEIIPEEVLDDELPGYQNLLMQLSQ